MGRIGQRGGRERGWPLATSTRVGSKRAGETQPEQATQLLGRPHPMHRLLQGEVGSGKTLCALRGMLQVVDAGGQAAILAPTEVLAAQHYRSIRELLGRMGRAGELDGADLATQVTLVTGSQGAAARRRPESAQRLPRGSRGTASRTVRG